MQTEYIGLSFLCLVSALVSFICFKLYSKIEKLRSTIDENDFQLKYEEKRKTFLYAVWGFAVFALIILVFLVSEFI